VTSKLEAVVEFGFGEAPLGQVVPGRVLLQEGGMVELGHAVEKLDGVGRVEF
jgi:hypothetical protein